MTATQPQPHSHSDGEVSRDQLWAATMAGNSDGRFIRAHSGSALVYLPFDGPANEPHSPSALFGLPERLAQERQVFSPSATFSTPGNFRSINRLVSLPDVNVPLGGVDIRTRFEHDLNLIKHSKPFRRLAGKTQVHLNPDDHQRTRLTHAMEVADIAIAMARALRLNVTLTEAIGLGHDCGHGPGGHASEDAFDLYLPGGFNHAIFGADVTLRPLNLCFETLDGIRNHSWSLHAPMTPEGEIVSFADRIAYVTHDVEDALSCAMITRQSFPAELAPFLNKTRGEQIELLINAVIQGTLEAGFVAMQAEYGELLGALRAFNLENIYKHEDSIEQNNNVVATLSQLVEFYAENIDHLPKKSQDSIECGDQSEIEAVVEYVAGMTDDFAYRQHALFVKNEPIVVEPTLHLL